MPARRTPRRADGWSDPGLARVAAWLGDSAGLTFPSNRGPGVEDALRAVMSRLGAADAEALLAHLQAHPEAREAALDAVTIGETYFFRDPAQLALLERVVLPTLASRPGGPRRLRAWSAGCASGEEPYTLAMLVREAGWAPGADVLGTDVAVARLATARRGRYGPWSMRGTSPERAARWFAAQANHVVVHPDVRADTTFRVLNLADDTWPSPASGVGQMDVILCRNVLIYFDGETIAGVARRLLAALAPDGWLLLGASDPPLTDLVACEVVTTRAGLLYRPPGAPPVVESPGAESVLLPVIPPSPRPAPSPGRAPTATRDATRDATRVERPVPVRVARETPIAAPAADATPDVAERAYAAADYAGAAEAARAAIAAGHDDPATRALLVRALANVGRLPEAGEACAAALARHPMEVELLLLHATLLLADERPADAAAAARRALYLDRGAPMSHVLLGDALARAGDAPAAARAFGVAAELLARLPADAAVPFADGETAGRLLRAARFRAATPGAPQVTRSSRVDAGVAR